MREIEPDEIVSLGRMVGLEIAPDRAETIAGRLSGVIDELDEIPDALLESVEPAHVFDAGREAKP